MNYWNRYPSNYLAKTLHLTAAQDGFYGRLLDWQYANEKPLPPDALKRYAIARASSKADRKDVDIVIGEFFTVQTEDGLYQPRAQREIESARGRINAAVTNGKAGGRPRKNPKPSDSGPNQEPDGNESGTHGKPSGFTESNPDAKPNESQTKALYSLTKAIPTTSGGKPPATPDFFGTPGESTVVHSSVPAAPVDLTKQVFDTGIALLTKAGKSEVEARKLVGKLRGAKGDDGAFAVIAKAQREGAVDPAAMLMAACAGTSRQSVHHGLTTKNYGAGLDANGRIIPAVIQ